MKRGLRSNVTMLIRARYTSVLIIPVNTSVRVCIWYVNVMSAQPCHVKGKENEKIAELRDKRGVYAPMLRCLRRVPIVTSVLIIIAYQ